MHLPDFVLLVLATIAAIAAGLAVLASKYNIARVLFWIAGLSFWSLGILWSATSEGYPLKTQLLVAAIVGAVAAAGLTWGLWEIRGKEDGEKKPSSIPAAPLEEPMVKGGIGGDGGSGYIKGPGAGVIIGGKGGKGGIMGQGGKGGDGFVDTSNPHIVPGSVVIIGGDGGDAVQPNGAPSRGGGWQRFNLWADDILPDGTRMSDYGRGGSLGPSAEWLQTHWFELQIQERWAALAPFVTSLHDQSPLDSAKRQKIRKNWR